jgi:hypothetical protein
MRILEKTTNLLSLYMHIVGRDEIPTAYYVWTCLAMIAACVSDRVYFYRRRERPIFPNLYTLLIGESGSGKNVAFDRMEDFIKDIPIINYRRQRVTAEFLLDILGKPTIDQHTGQKVLSNPRVFLAMPEITSYFRKGDHADTLIQMLTELYGGGATFSDGTRMHGETKVEGACINWAAGSTKEWLLKAMTPETVLSGFFARIITVYPEEEKNREGKTLRVWDQINYPADYYEVVDHIKARAIALTMLHGEMKMTEKAHSYVRQWNENRPEPTDEFVRPWWRRQREMVAKLSMLLSLADGKGPVIRQPHVSMAIKILASVEANLPDLIDYSQHEPSTEKTLKVKSVLKRHKCIDHTRLSRLISRNVNAKELQNAIFNLKNQKLVREEKTPTGGRLYIWEDGLECLTQQGT